MSSKTIGVCLSGGGHRASLFSLGALLYLVDAGRNRDVQVISSVSGGSLTNAFLASQASSFSSSWDAAKFDACAARFARSVAGNPRWWAIGITVHVILFLLWLSQLPSFLAFGPGWWHAQVAYAVAALLCARFISCRSGGSLWAYWGTWAYVSVLFPAVVMLVAIWRSTLPWSACLIVTAAVCVVFRCWNLVADRAFRRMILMHGDRARQKLADIQATPRHVFCATDMHAGEHAFFSKDLLYAPQLGVGIPENLALSTAVQVSANFPVGFPHRWLNTDRYDFYLFLPERRATWKLVLSDGGVCDNLGLMWFSDASNRVSDLRQRLGNIDALSTYFHNRSPVEDVRQRVVDQITSMERQPEVLICVNSSAPYTTRKVWLSGIPILAELASLVDVQSVMYNRLAIQVSRVLRRRFFTEPSTGAMVSIEDNPDTMTVLAASKPDEFTGTKNNYDISTDLLEPYRDAAQHILERVRLGPRHESEAAEIHHQIQELQDRINALREEAAREPQMSSRCVIDMEIDKLESERWNIALGHEMELQRRLNKCLDNTMHLDSIASSSRSTPTTLRPLGLEASAALLEHGYHTCMANCHLLLGFPRFDDPPGASDFARLAAGHPREHHPESWSTVPENERNLAHAAHGNSAA